VFMSIAKSPIAATHTANGDEGRPGEERARPSDRSVIDIGGVKEKSPSGS